MPKLSAQAEMYRWQQHFGTSAAICHCVMPYIARKGQQQEMNRCRIWLCSKHTTQNLDALQHRPDKGHDSCTMQTYRSITVCHWPLSALYGTLAYGTRCTKLLPAAIHAHVESSADEMLTHASQILLHKTSYWALMILTEDTQCDYHFIIYKSSPGDDRSL